MKWLLRITNSHRDLVLEEINTILPNSEKILLNDLLLLIETSEEKINRFIEISYSVRYIIKKPKIFPISTSIRKSIKQIDNFEIPQPPFEGTFAVRFFQVIDRDNSIYTPDIERYVGSIVHRFNPELEVNLDNPDIEFYVVAWGDGFAIGWVFDKTKHSEIGQRAPKTSPFFGGGGMKPLLCRILVNLLYPFDGRIMDPFCGHGGILREIADLDRFAIGLEISNKVIRESKINNYHHNYDGIINLILGNSLRPPIRKNGISQMVSDLPYSIQTTTKGMEVSNLVEEWLKIIDYRINLIVTLPSTVKFSIPNGWKLDFEIEDPVHKSLTRVARRLVRN